MFEIIKETNKALFICKDGKGCWIQKRWMRKDGSLTPAGLNSWHNMARVHKTKEDRTKILNLPILTKQKPDWENEKAIAFDAVVYFGYYDHVRESDGFFERRLRFFFPKNQIKNNEIPYWLVDEKYNEIFDELTLLRKKYREKEFSVDDSNLTKLDFFNELLRRKWDFDIDGTRSRHEQLVGNALPDYDEYFYKKTQKK